VGTAIVWCPVLGESKTVNEMRKKKKTHQIGSLVMIKLIFTINSATCTARNSKKQRVDDGMWQLVVKGMWNFSSPIIFSLSHSPTLFFHFTSTFGAFVVFGSTLFFFPLALSPLAVFLIILFYNFSMTSFSFVKLKFYFWNFISQQEILQLFAHSIRFNINK
jgi:hypothetical protein